MELGLASATADREIYYDPYDVVIDSDPYPVWKRMRDEAPLYYNDAHGFYALSRWDDVDEAIADHDTYISGQGSVLEIIKAGRGVPPGMVLGEDPPIHDLHRALISRVFTPRRMAALEPQVRQLVADTLDQFVGTDGFDFVVDLGAFIPMRVIGMMLGIPESDQAAIRDAGHERHHLEAGQAPKASDPEISMQAFAEYIDWRTNNPSDDLMTALLTVEFTDETGTRRRLSRTEVLIYTALLAGAGNETTRRLIGWTGQLLGDHPDQRRQVAADRDGLVARAVEETLRFEAPSPVQARVLSRDVELYGQTVPAGSALLLLNASANRDERHWPDADSFDLHRAPERHLSFGHGIHFCMGAGLARTEGRVVLDEMLKRWTDWEVDYDNAVLDHTSTTRGWMKLPIRLS
ncbi:cytochrome P450 [Pseudofrankia inefficax]|uniref:Cytochrome P450 n=1 Tax=Pseudofrankia inefficax (strain DSM 45817 / CECT 9037 / DDB 130130 / EuI1c) TaxID=298654 RepID=E3J9J7_PSEI1|nr:cytochrome P450 [Pseudofrankia inefficax]ADP83361.1 cytochrome P450 [Pseudofrankia inefficax]